MNSRQRFVLVFATVTAVPFTVFTFLNISDIGIYTSSYTILYFALSLMLNPKMRLRVDVLGIALILLSAYFVSQSAFSILHG